MAEVGAAEEGLGPLACRAVAGPVEAVPPHPQPGPLAGDRVGRGRLVERVEEGRLEEGHERQGGGASAEGPHGRDVRRVVGGGDEGELLHRCEHRLVDEPGPAERPRVHGLEADRGQVGERRHGPAGADDLVEAASDGGVVVGAVAARPADALDPALREHRLAGHLQQPVLERGAPNVRDQDLHGVPRGGKRDRRILHGGGRFRPGGEGARAGGKALSPRACRIPYIAQEPWRGKGIRRGAGSHPTPPPPMV